MIPVLVAYPDLAILHFGQVTESASHHEDNLPIYYKIYCRCVATAFSKIASLELPQNPDDVEERECKKIQTDGSRRDNLREFIPRAPYDRLLVSGRQMRRSLLFGICIRISDSAVCPDRRAILFLGLGLERLLF